MVKLECRLKLAQTIVQLPRLVLSRIGVLFSWRMGRSKFVEVVIASSSYLQRPHFTLILAIIRIPAISFTRLHKAVFNSLRVVFISSRHLKLDFCMIFRSICVFTYQ